MTAACAVTAPVVVPAGVVVAVASTAAIAQQPANDKTNPPRVEQQLHPLLRHSRRSLRIQRAIKQQA